MNLNEQLVDAVRRLDIEDTLNAISAGADVNYMVPENAKRTLWVDSSVLVVAIEGDSGVKPLSIENRPEIVRILLEAGADPNARNYERETCLMLSWDRYMLTKHLLDYGADPNLRGNYNISTVGFVSNRIDGLNAIGKDSREAEKVIKLLVERGGKL